MALVQVMRFIALLPESDEEYWVKEPIRVSRIFIIIIDNELNFDFSKVKFWGICFSLD